MTNDPYSLLADKTIANNCRLVRMPDNKLCVVVPLSNAISLETVSPPQHQSDALVIAEKTDRAGESEMVGVTETKHVKPAPLCEWEGRCDYAKIVRQCSFIWKQDRRTKIVLYDNLDGYGTVRRWMKPRHGRTIKDVPIIERPIPECLHMIEKWMKDGPYSWDRYDQPRSKQTKMRLKERRKTLKLRRYLIVGR